MADNKEVGSTDKGQSFLAQSFLKNQNMANKGKDITSILGSIDSFLKSNNNQTAKNKNSLVNIKDMNLLITSLNSLSKGIRTLNSNISKLSNSGNKSVVAERKDYVKKADPNKKLLNSVDDLESLMKENNKIQKDNAKAKKKDGGNFFKDLLMGISLALAGTGLIGFLLTGKTEFLFSLVKGMKHAFFDIPNAFKNVGVNIFKKILGLGEFSKEAKEATKLAKEALKAKKALNTAGKLLNKSKNLINKSDKAIEAGKLGKAAKLIKSGSKVLDKSEKALKIAKTSTEILKVGGKIGSSAASKSASKKIPIVGSILALMFAIDRFRKGDVVGGLLEIGSGLANLLYLTGIGAPAALGIQLLIDGIIVARDLSKAFGGKEQKEIKPKKTNKTDWKKIPVIGGLIGMFEGIETIAGGNVSTGVKQVLMSSFGWFPGAAFIMSKTFFPLIDGVEWVIKKTPEFLGMVGGKIADFAVSGFEEIKKLPIVGMFIGGIDSLINFAKDPKAGILGIANMMETLLPGSGELLITAGTAIFGAADYIVKNGGAALKWVSGGVASLMGSVKTADDTAKNDLNKKAEAEQKAKDEKQKAINEKSAKEALIKQKSLEKIELEKKAKNVANDLNKKSKDFNAKSEGYGKTAGTAIATNANAVLNTGGASNKASGSIPATKAPTPSAVGDVGTPPSKGNVGNIAKGIITTRSGKSAQVSPKYAAKFQAFIDELESTGYKIDSLGGFSDRAMYGGTAKSYHAFGAAIDINPKKNPYVKGTKLVTDMPANVGAIAAKYGIGWGGNWNTIKDAMHFSVAKSEGGFDSTLKRSNETMAVGGASRSVAVTPTSNTGTYASVSSPSTSSGGSSASSISSSGSSSNMPNVSIPSSSSISSSANNEINLSDSTIQKLAQAMGGSFKNNMPSPKSQNTFIDTNMRG